MWLILVTFSLFALVNAELYVYDIVSVSPVKELFNEVKIKF